MPNTQNPAYDIDNDSDYSPILIPELDPNYPGGPLDPGQIQDVIDGTGPWGGAPTSDSDSSNNDSGENPSDNNGLQKGISHLTRPIEGEKRKRIWVGMKIAQQSYCIE